MADNYLKVIKEIQKDLEKWQTLQLSWLGRIAVIKMSILLRLLFLFQTIPIILKQTFFQELKKITMKFVWAGKKPRVKMKSLQDFKHRAGMGLPEWQQYYRACSIVWLKDWITLEDTRLLKLEENNLLLGWQMLEKGRNPNEK